MRLKCNNDDEVWFCIVEFKVRQLFNNVLTVICNIFSHDGGSFILIYSLLMYFFSPFMFLYHLKTHICQILAHLQTNQSFYFTSWLKWLNHYYSVAHYLPIYFFIHCIIVQFSFVGSHFVNPARRVDDILLVIIRQA